MPNRHGQDDDYRYGYQGSEMDDEVHGTKGSSYTTHFRQLDVRIGRWLSIDPKTDKFPWQSPYVSMDNNPIWYNDIGGDEWEKTSTKTTTTVKAEHSYTFKFTDDKKTEGVETLITRTTTTIVRTQIETNSETGETRESIINIDWVYEGNTSVIDEKGEISSTKQDYIRATRYTPTQFGGYKKCACVHYPKAESTEDMSSEHLKAAEGLSSFKKNNPGLEGYYYAGDSYSQVLAARKKAQNNVLREGGAVLGTGGTVSTVAKATPVGVAAGGAGVIIHVQDKVGLLPQQDADKLKHSYTTTSSTTKNIKNEEE